MIDKKIWESHPIIEELERLLREGKSIAEVGIFMIDHSCARARIRIYCADEHGLGTLCLAWYEFIKPPEIEDYILLKTTAKGTKEAVVSKEDFAKVMGKLMASELL